MPILDYHYVGENKDFNFPLHSCGLDEFTRQLDFLKNHYQIVSLAEYSELKRKNADVAQYVSLVFDDGSAVHYDNVFPELLARKIPASFFPVASVFEGKAPAPIKMHIVFSQIDNGKIAEDLEKFLHKEIPRAIRLNPKKRLNDDILTSNIKQILSELPELKKEKFVNSQFIKVVEDEKQFCEKFFMRPEQLREMIAAGMDIGSHSYDHAPLDSLSFEEQKSNIHRSKQIIESVINKKVYSFSCPFGNYHKDTADLLRDAGFKYVIAYNQAENHDFIASCLDYGIFFKQNKI